MSAIIKCILPYLVNNQLNFFSGIVYMKLNPTLTKVLSSKILLNVIFVIAFIHVIGNLIMGNLHDVAFFILIGGLVSFFTKNMIIVLGVPIVFVSLFATSMIEGFEKKEGETKTSDAEKKKSEEKKMDEKKKMDEMDEMVDETEPKPSGTKIKPSVKKAEPEGKAVEEKFEVGRRNKGYDIDYASTVEDAYDDLNKILGGDGIKRLTADTQGLMQQQMELTKAMEGLEPMFSKFEPLLDKAKDMLKNLPELDSGMMDKLKGMGIKPTK
jgi:hypothetical protein